MIKERISLIKLILETDNLLYDHLQKVLNMDRKQLWYEINQVNYILKTLNLPDLKRSDRHLVVPLEIHDKKEDVIQAYYSKYQYIPREYRIYFVKLFILSSTEMISVNHLKPLLNVSRNTVLNTIKSLRDSLGTNQLNLNYSRELGYQILGNEELIRETIENSIHNLSDLKLKEEYVTNFFDSMDFKYSVDKISDKINKLCKIYDVEFVSERYEEFIYLFTIIANRGSMGFKMKDEIIGMFSENPLRCFSKDLCSQFGLEIEHEITYFTIRLLAGIRGNENIANDTKLYDLTLEIINRVNVLTLGALESRETKDLPMTLYEHLVPSYYRLLYDIPLINPYADKIKINYIDLFSLVERALEPLEKLVGKKISEEEVAYFTIHFGGYIKLYSQKTNIKAITVCPNGISSSVFLQSQIERLFPGIEIVGVFNSNQLSSHLDVDYDLIFSTIPLISDKPLVVMKPIMNPIERDIVIRKVTSQFNVKVSQKRGNVNDIIEIIERNAVISNPKQLIKELKILLNYEGNQKEENNLEDLLNRSLMQNTKETLTWEEAIELASQPLLNQEYISEAYIEAMISKVKEIGPYIVLAPLVAIPHARPEDGANKLGISLLRSKEPINFDFEGEIKPVKLIFVLSAVNNTSHLEVLEELSYLLEDQKNIDSMIEEEDLNTLLEFIYNNSKEG